MRIIAHYLLFAAIATTGCGQQISTTAHFAAQRQRMVEKQLKARGIKDERVLAAMAKVPREEFIPVDVRADAYEDGPLPIGYDQTISQPYVVAFMLTAPRVYYAMARDGLFFASVGKLFGKAEAPIVAIVLQGFAAIVISCSGTYGEILNFEVTVDFIFFAVTAAALFVLRQRGIGSDSVTYRVPGHPFTTMLVACQTSVIGLYLPPVFSYEKIPFLPPQTIISLPVHIAL